MDNLRGVLDYIKSFFGPPYETQRKRRAADPLDQYLSPKCRRIHVSMSNDTDDIDDLFLSRVPSRKSPILKPSRRNCQIDTLVLDDEDDIIEVKRPDLGRFQNKPKLTKFTSTPEDYSQRPNQKPYTNGVIEEDDISFVREIKSPREKTNEATKKGLNYIRPFTGRFFNMGSLHNGTKLKDRPTLLSKITKKSNNGSRPSFGSPGLDYSYRLDDKLQYKKLLETAGGSGPNNDSSIYQTPIGRLSDYDTSRSAKMVNMARTSSTSPSDNLNNSKGRMSTKDTIIKVLEDFVEVKDSDSDSDVIFLNPPSPKPDIKVDPINSLKKVVDTSQQTTADWLEDIVERHRCFVTERQTEIDKLKECSQRHEKINKDMRWEILTDKVKRSLSIRDAVLPVEEKEEEVELPPLTESQLKKVEYAFRGDPNETLARKFNLNISRRDLQTLAGLNWLNDEVINFYMNLIIERGKDSKWPMTYAFNTFFYTKLLKDGAQSLRRWTKRVDIFRYDIVCVPVHLGMHWCMAIIDFRDRSIRYYDSMGGSNNKCLELLRKYLEAEHMDKKKTGYNTSDFELENVKDIPQQMNGSDCGMFACTFAEFLARNAKISFSQEHMSYLRKKMVVEILSGELLIK